MYKRFRTSIGIFWHRYARIALIVFFLLGLCSGSIYACRAASSADSFITLVAGERATLIGLLITALLPLIFAALFSYFSVPALLLPICLLKSFAFSFCSTCVLRTFGDSGWLVRLLLLFTDSVALLPLLWFCFRQVSGNRRMFRKDFMLSFLTALVVCILDFLFVSPFLATLF